MARDCGLCQPCSRAGFVRLASEVDHIVSKATWRRERGSLIGCDDETNLQAICGPCHAEKTLREMGRSTRPEVGVDGWPVS